jgi:hypothetical protein
MHDKQKLFVHIGDKTVDVPLPEGMTLRPQNPACNKQQKVCAKMGENLVCAKLIMKEDSHGNFEYFSLEPCQKSDNKKVFEI